MLYLIIIRKNGKTALTQSCVCVVDNNLLVFFFHSLYSHKASHHDSLVIVITSENTTLQLGDKLVIRPENLMNGGKWKEKRVVALEQ